RPATAPQSSTWGPSPSEPAFAKLSRRSKATARELLFSLGHPMNARTEYRYNRLTWADMNEAIAAQKLVILPTGSTEQHGRHLPLDVDVFLCESVCLEVGRRAADRVLVLPPISYGLNLHHIDFPGTIHIEPETFIAFCLNITKSVAYHG